AAQPHKSTNAMMIDLRMAASYNPQAMKWYWSLLCLALLGCANHAPQLIRPGIPGKQPFWNANAKQFIWPPAFDFQPVPGAARYRFVCGELHFDASEPWTPLTPIWNDIPVGMTAITVTALDNSGHGIATVGERRFHRAARFKGPYLKPVVSYSQSARAALA